MLQSSRIKSKLSVYNQLEGNIDFNNTPSVPPGTRVLIHVKPKQWTSWDPYDVPG